MTWSTTLERGRLDGDADMLLQMQADAVGISTEAEGDLLPSGFLVRFLSILHALGLEQIMKELAIVSGLLHLTYVTAQR